MYHVAIASDPSQPSVVTVGVANVHVDLFGVVEQLKRAGVRHVRTAANDPTPGSADAIKAEVVNALLYELGFDAE